VKAAKHLALKKVTVVGLLGAVEVQGDCPSHRIAVGEVGVEEEIKANSLTQGNLKTLPQMEAASCRVPWL